MTGFGAQRKHMTLPTNIRSRLEERTFALRLSDGKVGPKADPHGGTGIGRVRWKPELRQDGHRRLGAPHSGILISARDREPQSIGDFRERRSAGFRA